MRLQGLLFAAAMAVAPLAANATTIAFSDDFNAGASAEWSNAPGLGNWSSAGGVYNAQQPSNNPLTYSGLSFVFDGSDLTLDVDVNDIGDGGIWINTDGTNQNGVLLVLGGDGYGPTNGAQGGRSIYWHVVVNGNAGAALNAAANVFTPGDDYHLTVKAQGGQFQAFVNNGPTAVTTLTSNTYVGGKVGLYDEWGPMTFDNFSVTGSAAVPEPGTWALMILGLGGAGAALRQRRRAVA